MGVLLCRRRSLLHGRIFFFLPRMRGEGKEAKR
jgi:hypothetical protein